MKKRFFSLDRHRKLKQGQLIELTSHDIVIDGLKGVELLYGDEPKKELQSHANLLFPLGVSEQGNRYLLHANMSANFSTRATNFLGSCESLDQARKGIENALSENCNATTEIIFEYVRRGYFPDKPSRFTSFFAWETLDQAEEFRRKYGDGCIWEVECDKEPFLADMNLLSLRGSVLVLSYNAHRYWAGLPSTNISTLPCWEVLLPLPVRVLQQVG